METLRSHILSGIDEIAHAWDGLESYTQYDFNPSLTKPPTGAYAVWDKAANAIIGINSKVVNRVQLVARTSKKLATPGPRVKTVVAIGVLYLVAKKVKQVLRILRLRGERARRAEMVGENVVGYGDLDGLTAAEMERTQRETAAAAENEALLRGPLARSRQIRSMIAFGKAKFGLPANTPANVLAVRGYCYRELVRRGIHDYDKTRLLPLVVAGVFVATEMDVEAAYALHSTAVRDRMELMSDTKRAVKPWWKFWDTRKVGITLASE